MLLAIIWCHHSLLLTAHFLTGLGAKTEVIVAQQLLVHRYTMLKHASCWDVHPTFRSALSKFSPLLLTPLYFATPNSAGTEPCIIICASKRSTGGTAEWRRNMHTVCLCTNAP